MLFELCYRLLLAFSKDKKIVPCEITYRIPIFISHIDLNKFEGYFDFVAEPGLFLLSWRPGIVSSEIWPGQNKEGKQDADERLLHPPN